MGQSTWGSPILSLQGSTFENESIFTDIFFTTVGGL